MKQALQTNKKKIRRGSLGHKILNLKILVIHIRLKFLKRRYANYSRSGLGYNSELQKTSGKIIKLNEKLGKMMGYDSPIDKSSKFSPPKPQGDWDTGRFPWDHH